MKINLTIVQPVGYVHALGFVEQARYFRYQFRRMGYHATISKNRLTYNALNFVFGAHVGIDPDWLKGQTYAFVNLEQLVDGGAQLPNEYIELLRNNAVVDYDARNVEVYGSGRNVPIVQFLYAPYLKPIDPTRLHNRPIDLLFMGALTAPRCALIDRIRAKRDMRFEVSPVLFGPERDEVLSRTKAVLNIHAYPSAIFEQTRASFVLSNGVPLIHALVDGETVPEPFVRSIETFHENDPGEFFDEYFLSTAFYRDAHQSIAGFAETDPLNDYVAMLDSVVASAVKNADTTPRTRINIGSGKDYRPGWINIDILELTRPDVVLDLCETHIPSILYSSTLGPMELKAGTFKLIYASNVLEHVTNLPQLMTNCLTLLEEGGVMYVEVPYDGSPQAWQDPTHVRAMNENSWLYYTVWFWYLGWFEHRFESIYLRYLDEKMEQFQSFTSAASEPAFMSLTLTKVKTTPEERTTARTYQQNFGGLPEDA